MEQTTSTTNPSDEYKEPLKIKIQCIDSADIDDTMEVKTVYAKKMDTLMNYIKDIKPVEGQTVPIQCKKVYIEKIFEYIDHYYDEGIPEKYSHKEYKTEQIREWDMTFINDTFGGYDHRNILREFHSAAAAMGVESLVSLISKYTAGVISELTKGVPNDEAVVLLRGYFNCPDDLSPERKAELKEKFKWARDDEEEEKKEDEQVVEEMEEEEEEGMVEETENMSSVD